MSIDERFQALSETQRRAVAAVAAGRVLPIFRYLRDRSTEAFEDGLRLVWFELDGQNVCRQDYARVINAAVATVPQRTDDPVENAARQAGLAALSVLEGAQHNPEALTDALLGAQQAVAAFAGEDAADEERRWQSWAVTRAAGAMRPHRDLFSGRDAPRVTWLDQVGARDLPLLKGAEE